MFLQGLYNASIGIMYAGSIPVVRDELMAAAIGMTWYQEYCSTERETSLLVWLMFAIHGSRLQTTLFSYICQVEDNLTIKYSGLDARRHERTGQSSQHLALSQMFSVCYILTQRMSALEIFNDSALYKCSLNNNNNNNNNAIVETHHCDLWAGKIISPSFRKRLWFLYPHKDFQRLPAKMLSTHLGTMWVRGRSLWVALLQGRHFSYKHTFLTF